MGDVGRPLRPIAPRSIFPGDGPGANQSPGGGGSGDDGKVRRASTACKECQKRRTKCSGAPSPCSECQTHQRECIFDQDSDRRRKGSLKRTQDDLAHERNFVEQLLSVFREGHPNTVQQLIHLVRSGTPREELQAIVQQLVSNGPPPDPSPRHDAGLVPTNDHMPDFFDHR